jgi:hypothetical protein
MQERLKEIKLRFGGVDEEGMMCKLRPKERVRVS